METNNQFDVNKAFFVIDSDNLEQIQSKLYGYAIIDCTVVEDVAALQTLEPTGDGAYVYIKRAQNTITLTQDFIGSFGLYLFKEGDYFAISNSFLLLVDHIKGNYRISLNRDYANSFLVADLCSVAYSETMVNEIRLLDRCTVIEIDIPSRQLSIQYIDYQENTVELSTKEGMRILDNWFQKWTGLIKKLKRETNNIQVDLSGGFDSRLIINLMLGSHIDLNDIYVFSIEDKLHTHAEDFEIASVISDYYQFQLNNKNALSWTGSLNTVDDIINISFYTKLSFHKQPHFMFSARDPKRHIFGGLGGECIRAYWNMSESEFIENTVKRCNIYSNDTAESLESSVRTILASAFTQIREKFDSFGRSIDPQDITMNLYRETRCRNHFGKEKVEHYFGGEIKYSPLLDPDLHKLKLTDSQCGDKNLLMAIMFSRYNKDLLNFKFDGKRSIEHSTICYAQKINKAFPYAPIPTLASNGIITVAQSASARKKSSNPRLTNSDVNPYVEQAFHSGIIKGTFIMLYGEDAYKKICEDINVKKFHPLQNAYAVLSISKIAQDVFASEAMHTPTAAAFLRSHLEPWTTVENVEDPLRNDPYIDNYITLRVDIKNMTVRSGGIEITEISDRQAKITTPQWFTPHKEGYILESSKGTLKITFRCVKTGNLSIAVRSRDVRDADNNRIPFWLDCYEVKINDKIYVNHVFPLWHDKPLKINRCVKDGEIIRLSISWKPHDDRLSRLR